MDVQTSQLPATRSPETMMAELVHHMAELVKTQKETNQLLAELLRLQRSA